MQLIHFVWIISLLVARQAGEHMPSVPASRGWTCAIGIVLGLGLIGKLGAVQAAFRPSDAGGERLLSIWRTWIEWIWVGGLFWVTMLSGWPSAVKSILPLPSTAIEIAIYAIPSCILTLMLELAHHQLFVFQRDRRIARQQSAKTRIAVDNNSLIQHLVLSFRHGWLILLVPTIAVTALSDLIALTGTSESTSAALLCIGSLILISIGFPSFVSWLWKTRTLGRNKIVTPICNAVGIPDNRVMTWDTQNRITNAAVVGWLPPWRRLLISDGLLNLLPADQIRMILLHEIAHIRRFHFFARMLPVLFGIVLLWIVLLCSRLPAFEPLSNLISDTSLRLGIRPTVSLYSMAGCTLAISVITSCYIARRTELDADSQAVQLAVRLGLFDGCESTAANHLITALKSLVSADRYECSSWLHPSISARIASLRGKHITYSKTPAAGQPHPEHSCDASPSQHTQPAHP